MTEKETPTTDNSQADDNADDKNIQENTEVGKEESSDESTESLLVSDGKEEEKEEAKEETKEEEVKPEVEYDLKLPEDSMVSEDVIEEVTAFAKENGLSNEAAQVLIEREDKAVKGWLSVQQDEFAATQKKWIEEAKNDKEFGRDNFEKTNKGVKKLIDEFADDELKNFLKQTGYDSSVHVWRLLARIDRARQGDKIATAEAAASSREVPIEQKLYPGMFK